MAPSRSTTRLMDGPIPYYLGTVHVPPPRTTWGLSMSPSPYYLGTCGIAPIPYYLVPVVSPPSRTTWLPGSSPISVLPATWQLPPSVLPADSVLGDAVEPR